MPTMDVRFDGPSPAEDLKASGREMINLTGDEAPDIRAYVMERGMISGAMSVIFRIDLPGEPKRSVMVETSASLVNALSRMMQAKAAGFTQEDRVQ